MSLMGNRRDTVMVIILYISAFSAAYCNNLINVALVEVMKDFSISSVTAQWLVSGYTIVTVITVMSMAFIYRRFTTRQIFFTAQSVFFVAGIGCYFAPTFPILLAVRLFQGIGVGMAITLMMNVVMALAPVEKRGFAMGLGSTFVTLAPVIAPAVSGIMIGSFGWHSIFAPLVAISGTLLVTGAVFLRNVNKSRSASLDVFSALLMAVALAVFAFGLTRLVSHTLLGVVCLLVGGALFAAFAHRQHVIDDPFLVLTPLKRLKFWPACILVFIAVMSVFSVNLLLPLYFQGGLGFTALDVGLLMLVVAIFNSALGLFSGRLYDIFGSWPLITIGYGFIVVGQIVMLVMAGQYLVAPIAVGACIASVGIGMTTSPIQVAGLSTLELELQPHGVSLMSASIQITGCIAPSLYVGVMNALQDQALAAGAAMNAAVASGLFAALCVALACSVIALVLSVVYTRVILKRT